MFPNDTVFSSVANELVPIATECALLAWLFVPIAIEPLPDALL